VIGDIGGEIGGLAIVTYNHPILLIAEVGGAEPEGSVLFINVIAMVQAFNGLVNGA